MENLHKILNINSSFPKIVVRFGFPKLDELCSCSLHRGGNPTQQRSKVALCHFQRDPSPPSFALWCWCQALEGLALDTCPPAGVCVRSHAVPWKHTHIVNKNTHAWRLTAMTDEALAGTSLQAKIRGKRSFSNWPWNTTCTHKRAKTNMQISLTAASVGELRV